MISEWPAAENPDRYEVFTLPLSVNASEAVSFDRLNEIKEITVADIDATARWCYQQTGYFPISFVGQRMEWHTEDITLLKGIEDDHYW